MRKEKGITLVSLIITIAVLIIIVSVSVSVGTSSLDSTRLKGFYMQLEIVQKRVDDIATTNESYINETGNTIFLKEQGKSFAEMGEKQEVLKQILATNGGDNLTGFNFRYFTSKQLIDILGVSNIDYNLFIDFENRIIIAEQGIKINGVKYYMLESTAYFIKNNPNKNIGSIDFSASVSKYGMNKYKLTIIPNNTVGDIQSSGIVKYKKTTTKYWEISDITEIIVEFDVEYNIIYLDSNKNSKEKILKVEYEKDNDGNLIKDEEGNNIIVVTEVTPEEREEI